MILFTFFVSALTLLVVCCFVSDLRRLRRVPRLTQAQIGSVQQPLVSVLIPARNEARNIARCLDGALAQTYARYEVIVVDDGSTDATPDILARYAVQHPRLRVLKGRPLPNGWTGKSNACQQLAEAAKSEWLLFLDADTVPQPMLIAALSVYAQTQRLDMLSIFPFLELGSFWERVVLPVFFALIMIIFPFGRMTRPDTRPEEVLAYGQCIFVRRAAYEDIGGHGAVRSEVLEDVRLAQALRAAGFVVGAAAGLDALHVRMYTNGREVAEGLTKNAAAGFRNGGARSMLAMMRLVLTAFAPPATFIVGIVMMSVSSTYAWLAFVQGMVMLLIAIAFWSGVLSRVYRLPWFYGVFWPLGLVSYMIIAARGMLQVYSGRGVTWKGRVYVGE